MSEWAAQHFYLSPESSYVEGRWKAYPYQIPIMDAISNDDIKEVTLQKSARVGYTKIILAAMAYFAVHKKRNQGVWQPVDADADEFVKTEIDTMIRDVPAVQAIFPFYNVKSKYNTLRLKAFFGSGLHIRGGKSAKNYRRLTLSVAYQDEADGFDADIEKEGPSDNLIIKRLEGATFPKFVCGSTPTIEGASLIARRLSQADGVYQFHVPCPHCGYFQPLVFGGKEESTGLKWLPNRPETAVYLCVHCSATFAQTDYLAIWQEGIYRDASGNWFDRDLRFFNADNVRIPTPLHIGFKIWTAYSPQATWADIAHDWLKAKDDPLQQKFFTNTTLGETWKEKEERADTFALQARAEALEKRLVPEGVRCLTAAVDIQSNRFVVQVLGWGEQGERWLVDRFSIRWIVRDDTRVPIVPVSRQEDWLILISDVLSKPYPLAWDSSRGLLPVMTAIDTGGEGNKDSSVTERAYGFWRILVQRGLAGKAMLIKGRPNGPRIERTYPDSTGRSDRKANARGDIPVWMLNVNILKDSLAADLDRTEPGPSYIHFPDWLGPWFYDELTAETKTDKGWENRGRRPNEATDLMGYNTAAWLRLGGERINWQSPPAWADPERAAIVLNGYDGAAGAAPPAASWEQLLNLQSTKPSHPYL